MVQILGASFDTLLFLPQLFLKNGLPSFVSVRAHEERIDAVLELARQLGAENFSHADDVHDRADAILNHWKKLLDLLSVRRAKVDEAYRLYQTFSDMNMVENELQMMRMELHSDIVGNSLQEAEGLVQRHVLHDSNVAVLLQRVYDVNAQAQAFIDAVSCLAVRPEECCRA